MTTRLAFVFGVLLMACSSAPAEDNANGSSASTKNPTASAVSLDGSWDITGDLLAPSQMTVSGGSIEATLVSAQEGTTNGGCTITRARATVSLKISGNTLSGSERHESERTGECAPDDITSGRHTVTGTRKGAGTQTILDGEWELRVDDGAPLVGTIAGLVGQFNDKQSEAQHLGSQVTVNFGGSTITGADVYNGRSWAARKR